MKKTEAWYKCKKCVSYRYSGGSTAICSQYKDKVINSEDTETLCSESLFVSVDRGQVFCKDCQHSTSVATFGKYPGELWDLKYHPPKFVYFCALVLNPVTRDPASCLSIRADDSMCGFKGAQYKERPKHLSIEDVVNGTGKQS